MYRDVALYSLGMVLGLAWALWWRRHRRSLWRHRKGGVYELFGEGRHTETLEKLCAYRSTANGDWWFRPVEMFHDGRFKELR